MFKDTPVFSSFSVDDIDRAKTFYRDVLELVVTEGKEGLSITFGNGKSHFIYPKENHEPATFTVLNFVVPNIDEAVQELKIRGIQLEKYDEVLGMVSDEKGIMRGKDAGMGPDIAWFKDPAGNILAVMEE
jgi:predicted enzyme related to lactoylglutathione lyase